MGNGAKNLTQLNSLKDLLHQLDAIANELVTISEHQDISGEYDETISVYKDEMGDLVIKTEFTTISLTESISDDFGDWDENDEIFPDELD